MSHQEHPQHGGSYVRQPDGSLKRADDVMPAAAPDPEPAKPAGRTSKKEK